jgi:hypothetical protein
LITLTSAINRLFNPLTNRSEGFAMLKHVLLSLIVVGPIGVAPGPVIGLSAALAAPPDAVCYWQTPDRRVINLDRLCTAAPPAAKVNDPRMVVSRVTYDGQRIQGAVVNQTGQMVKRVAINYTVVAPDGKQLDAGVITQRGPLAPGAAMAFNQASAHPGGVIQIAAIDWHP